MGSVSPVISDGRPGGCPRRPGPRRTTGRLPKGSLQTAGGRKKPGSTAVRRRSGRDGSIGVWARATGGSRRSGRALLCKVCRMLQMRCRPGFRHGVPCPGGAGRWFVSPAPFAGRCVQAYAPVPADRMVRRGRRNGRYSRSGRPPRPKGRAGAGRFAAACR